LGEGAKDVGGLVRKYRNIRILPEGCICEELRRIIA
jgi:hypothetical protein